MLVIELSWDQIFFFLALVVSGSLYGWYCYNKGTKRGWDKAIFSLEDAGMLYVDDDGEVCRVSDKEFKKFKESMESCSE